MPRWVRPTLIGIGVLLVLWLLNIARVRQAEQQAFARAMPGFAARIAQTPRTAGQPRLLDWAWKETGAAIGAQIFETIVYDESDEIGRPPAALSAGWRARASVRLKDIAERIGHRNRNDEVDVRRIDDHFYLVTETIQ